MVRDWIDMPLSALEANVAAWFLDHELASGHTGAGPYYPLIRLVLATGRWDRQVGRYAQLDARNAQRPPVSFRQLLRAALLQAPLSSSLLAHLVKRVRTDLRIDDPRAALLRLLLVRSPNPRMEATPVLDPANRDPAYLAGRVFATLESIQYNVSRDKPNTTFADRYFAGAMVEEDSSFRPRNSSGPGQAAHRAAGPVRSRQRAPRTDRLAAAGRVPTRLSPPAR
jgi:CRISPR-associated protein Csd1